MGRPEKPIVTTNAALRDLAVWLRERREGVGRPSYRELATRAGCHATTLQRAASGETVPRLVVVIAYAQACDASPGEAKRRWKQARYEEARTEHRRPKTPPPPFIRDLADLSAGLQDLYEKAGLPPVRTMEERAGRYGILPRSTAYRIRTKQAMPHSLDQFRGFLRACEVPKRDQAAWEQAWVRAWRHEKQDSLAETEFILYAGLDREGKYVLRGDPARMVRDKPGEVILPRERFRERLKPKLKKKPKPCQLTGEYPLPLFELSEPEVAEVGVQRQG